MGNTNTKSSPPKKSSPAVIQSALLVKPLLRSSGLGKLNVLPDDVVLVIFSFLTHDDLLKISSVSNVFYILSQKDLLWRGIAQDTGWKSQETMGPREYLHGRISQFNAELSKLSQTLTNIDNISRGAFMHVAVKANKEAAMNTLPNILMKHFCLVSGNNFTWLGKDKPLGPIKDIVPVLKLLPALNAFFNQVYLIKSTKPESEMGVLIFNIFYERTTNLLAECEYSRTATSASFIQRMADYLATNPPTYKISLLELCISSPDFLFKSYDDTDIENTEKMIKLINDVKPSDVFNGTSKYSELSNDILRDSGLSANANLDKRLAEIKSKEEQAVKRFNRNM